MGGELIDVVMPAVRRPELLEPSLRTMRELVLTDVKRHRLFVNVDPVGPGTTEQVLALCRKYFPDVIPNCPTEQGSLNRALMWLWAQPESEFVFYTEDDNIAKRPIDLDAIVAAMRAHPQVAFCQLPQLPLPAEVVNDGPNVRQTYDPAAGWFWRTGPYRMALQPAVIRRDFMRQVAAAWTTTGGDPEVQFHRGNVRMAEIVGRYTYATWGKPGDDRAVQDWGVTRKRNDGYAKIVDKQGTTWVKVLDVRVHGSPLKILDADIGRKTWQDAASGHWRADTYKVMAKMLRPEMIFVDAGAYIGTIALWAAQHCKHVYAFEPDRVAFNVLAENLNLNRVAYNLWNVTLSDRALTRQSGSVPLFLAGGIGDGLSRIIPNVAGPHLVGGNDLKEAMRFYSIPRIDYLKVTTQGDEAPMLSSPEAMAILSAYKPILHVGYQPGLARNKHEYIEQFQAVMRLYRHVQREDNLSEVTPDLIATPDWAERKVQTILVASDRGITK